MRRRTVAFACAALVAGGLALGGPPRPAGAGAEPRRLLVSGASDLAKAFPEIGARFTKRTGIKVDFNFASTGSLAAQIENGAPVDLFAAADVATVVRLEKKGLVVPGTRETYAFGRLVLWVSPNLKIPVRGVEDLARSEIQRIAIANPDHAPYGMAARQALQSVGLWEKVLPKIVYGENVRQALQYAEAGAVDAALTARSLTGMCRGLACKGKWIPVPERLHRPIEQTLCIVQGTKHEREAREFITFLRGDGCGIMVRHGFVVKDVKVAGGKAVERK